MIRVAILVGSLLASIPSNVQSEIDIIANQSVPIDTISRSEISAIFTGRKTKWNDGTDIKIYVMPSFNPATVEFFTGYLGILPSTYWHNIIDDSSESEVVFVPNLTPSDFSLYNAIDCTPGSIGYIQHSEYLYYHFGVDSTKVIKITH